jgi:hypothetical protein
VRLQVRANLTAEKKPDSFCFFSGCVNDSRRADGGGPESVEEPPWRLPFLGVARTTSCGGVAYIQMVRMPWWSASGAVGKDGDLCLGCRPPLPYPPWGELFMLQGMLFSIKSSPLGFCERVAPEFASEMLRGSCAWLS